jgi:hypothetical protein
MLMRRKQAGLSSLTFELIPVPPFSREYTAWALRRRSENLVDLWDSTKYQRVPMLEGRPVEVQVSQRGGNALRIPRACGLAAPADARISPNRVFPADDVGARNRLAKWIRFQPPMNYEGVGVIARGRQADGKMKW